MSEQLKKSNHDDQKENDEKERNLEDREPTDKEKEKKIGKPVIIKADAYKTIILYGSRYANNAIPPDQWKEIYGILIGHSDNEFVYIERAEALTFGHATNVQLDHRHYGFIEEIQNELDEERGKNYIIGWFHSHPGLGLFFSYVDLINQTGFQEKNDDACGLVFDHTLLGKKREEKIEETNHLITKYDTGFEIYRITDTSMDINHPDYENNYHKVEYVVDGLNKFFFANILSELSALVTAGKPLQSAYGEHYQLETSYKDAKEVMELHPEPTSSISESKVNIHEKILTEIPISKDITFGVDDFFYGEKTDKKSEVEKKKEIAEQLIYEGNLAFKNKDAFMGIEKYRQGIGKYKELNDTDRVFELLKGVAEQCITNDHLVLAEEFSENLRDLANEKDDLFYRGESNYLIGYLALKKGDDEILESALNRIRDAAIDFEKVKDYAGAAMCFHKIGTIYQSRLNKLDNSSLFYREAIENYNKSILRSHPLRKSLWSKPESLVDRIKELRDLLDELIPNIENPDIKKKIIQDLKSIKYNF